MKKILRMISCDGLVDNYWIYTKWAVTKIIMAFGIKI